MTNQRRAWFDPDFYVCHVDLNVGLIRTVVKRRTAQPRTAVNVVKEKAHQNGNGFPKCHGLHRPDVRFREEFRPRQLFGMDPGTCALLRKHGMTSHAIASRCMPGLINN